MAVFLPNWVGDVVMATPALRALRRGLREARITYVGRPASLATLAGSPDADGAIADRSARAPKAAATWELVRQLRRARLDLAVLLPNSFRTALVAKLGGARRAAGYDRDGRGLLLSDKLDPPRGPDGRKVPTPAMDYYIRLVEHLGVACPSRQMTVPVLEADRDAAEALLACAGADDGRPVVMLNPGASFGTSKMWDPSRYAALADLLIERRGAAIVINAAPSERPIARQVERAMRHEPAASFARRDNSLGLLKALLGRCDLLVTNDTGARHLGAAMGVGVVTLFGSTDPQWSRIDYGRERIVRVAVDCAPCQKKLCPLPAGPTYHQCMERITPRMALEAAEQLLDGEPPRKEASA